MESTFARFSHDPPAFLLRNGSPNHDVYSIHNVFNIFVPYFILYTYLFF